MPMTCREQTSFDEHMDCRPLAGVCLHGEIYIAKERLSGPVAAGLESYELPAVRLSVAPNAISDGAIEMKDAHEHGCCCEAGVT